MSAAAEVPTCFIAMPITMSEEHVTTYGDPDHWSHVLEELFVPAVEMAGFAPLRPISRGSEWIHAAIIEQLTTADMVLVDLSSHNPNVFFELGVRTALDKPVALIRSLGTTIPFDTSGMNTPEYDPDLRPWKTPDQIAALAEHIKNAVDTCRGGNPVWRQFGLAIKAEEPVAEGSREDARLELLTESVGQMRDELRAVRDATPVAAPTWVPSSPHTTDEQRQTEAWIAGYAKSVGLTISMTWTHKNSLLIRTEVPGASDDIGTTAFELRKQFRGQVRSYLAGSRFTVRFEEGSHI